MWYDVPMIDVFVTFLLVLGAATAITVGGILITAKILQGKVRKICQTEEAGLRR